MKLRAVATRRFPRYLPVCPRSGPKLNPPQSDGAGRIMETAAAGNNSPGETIAGTFFPPQKRAEIFPLPNVREGAAGRIFPSNLGGQTVAPHEGPLRPGEGGGVVEMGLRAGVSEDQQGFEWRPQGTPEGKFLKKAFYP